MNSSKTQLKVDRHAVAEITGNRAIVDVLMQAGPAIQGMDNARELLGKLLDVLCERIPAERAAVLLAVPKSDNLKHGASRGTPFEANAEIGRLAFRERTATLTNGPKSILCVPLWLYDSGIGAVYLESDRAEAFRIEHLHLAIAIAWEVAVLIRHLRHADGLQALVDQLGDYVGIRHGLAGNTPPMVALRKEIDRVALVDTTVLILGEMGTGKELIARAIHKASPRKPKPFLAVNCAAITRDLIANELFGNERGGFTGAISTAGKIEMADTGTFFLDEIGDLDRPAQGSLLRVLEECEFQRVGGNRTIQVDVRVIAATNCDLEAAVAAKGFRGDLYHRIAVFPIQTTPLREIQV